MVFTYKLNLASQNGHFETCKLLLAYGADINAKQEIGASSLHFGIFLN
jgi:ankyrin repeat protein